MTFKKAWGEDRVFYRDHAGQLRHLPVEWTSAAPVDPFKEIAAGRCRFRTEDLPRLADLLEKVKG